MNDSVTIPGTTVRLDYVACAEEHTVSIYMNGTLWDWRTFESESGARAFMADPFKEQRATNEARADLTARREAESVGYYAADYVRISKGRQVGPNRR